MAKGKSKQGAGKPPPRDTKERRADVTTLPAWKTHSVELKRLPADTVKSYAALLAYAHTDPSHRSLRALQRHLGQRSLTTCQDWSRAHHWQTRIKAFDAKVFKLGQRVWHQAKLQADLVLLEDEREAQSTAKKALTSVVVKRLIGIVEDGERDSDAVAASKTLMDIADHRPDRPEPPPPVHGEGSHDYKAAFAAMRTLGLSAEDIRRIVAAARAGDSIPEE